MVDENFQNTFAQTSYNIDDNISLNESVIDAAIDNNGDIYTIPHSDLKIEKTIEPVPGVEGQEHITSFTVTTPEGMVYHFGGWGEGQELHGVDLSNQVNFTLPNHFTYAEPNRYA